MIMEQLNSANAKLKAAHDNRERDYANEIASVILDPKNYGIKSIQLLDTNTFSVTNVKTSLSDLNVTKP